MARVLLADPAGRDHATRGKRNGAAEHRLRHEDAFGVVPQSAMPKVGEDFLALIEPVMDGGVVFEPAAPFAH